ncbi:hypothetical protein FDH01_gp183 [Acinetobacter phage vB_AbaM_ME3]|uniref:Uncharacterized protein n=1 Tax=Acinetobacter phage vB_AbaM_ME3 TaxID=1837876 RepID=A0A172Q0X1_9CAUD|nr:hypothetical protein FDH01_gp183 [Acinetobacter phage vB_AbaM_ME3]AND75439.1 hypothetical protein ME3_278 [Acinetobacter phage vB_AbaM_ME3]
MIKISDIASIRNFLPDVFYISGFNWLPGNKRATTVRKPIAVSAHHKDKFISPVSKNGEVNWYNNLYSYSPYAEIYAFATEQEAIDHYLQKVTEHAKLVEEDLQKELETFKGTRDRYMKL